MHVSMVLTLEDDSTACPLRMGWATQLGRMKYNEEYYTTSSN